MTSLITLLSVLWLLCLPANADVDLNTASRTELETLPGIGPSKAAAIVEYRNANGPFTNVNQLDNVPGIGAATLNNLRPLVTVGDRSPANRSPANRSPADGSSEGRFSEGRGQTALPDRNGAVPAPSLSANLDGQRIDINSASVEALDTLPGVGPSMARAIVEYRNTHGPFSSCADLKNVPRIGEATVSTLRRKCIARQPGE